MLKFRVFLGSASCKTLCHYSISCNKVQGLVVRCSNLELKATSSRERDQFRGDVGLIKRRNAIALVLGVSGLFIDSVDARGAGLPPEQKPRLCDDACEKELENVW